MMFELPPYMTEPVFPQLVYQHGHPRPGWRCKLFGHAFKPRYHCEPAFGHEETAAIFATVRPHNDPERFEDLLTKRTYAGEICYRCGTILMMPPATTPFTAQETTHEFPRSAGLDPSGVPSDCHDGDRNGYRLDGSAKWQS